MPMVSPRFSLGGMSMTASLENTKKLPSCTRRAGREHRCPIPSWCHPHSARPQRRTLSALCYGRVHRGRLRPRSEAVFPPPLPERLPACGLLLWSGGVPWYSCPFHAVAAVPFLGAAALDAKAALPFSGQGRLPRRFFFPLPGTAPKGLCRDTGSYYTRNFPLVQCFPYSAVVFFGFRISRQSRSPRSRPWMSISAVATLVAQGMLY